MLPLHSDTGEEYPSIFARAQQDEAAIVEYPPPGNSTVRETRESFSDIPSSPSSSSPKDWTGLDLSPEVHKAAADNRRQPIQKAFRKTWRFPGPSRAKISG